MTTTQRYTEQATKMIDVAIKVCFPILLGCAGWTFTQLTSHEGRLVRLETRADARDKNDDMISQDLREIKNDVKQLLGR